MKNHWYNDNWNGARKEFNSLKKAIESAKQEDGISVSIYNNNGVAKIVTCNGYTYP